MTLRRLFISGIETNFNPVSDVAAGPWCFADREEDVEGWGDMHFTDAFADSRDLVEADTRTRRLANHIALSWADRMNAETGRAYSSAMWRNFLILWIVAATQSTWRCYCNIELLMKRHGDEPFHVNVLKGNPDWPISDLSSFMRLLTLDGYFTFWMHSLMLREMAPDSWTLESVARETSTSHVMAKPSPESTGLENRKPLSAFVGRLGFDHVHGTKYIRPFFSLLINLLPRRPSAGKVFLPDESIEQEFPAPFLALLNEFLEATRPSDFGENLPNFLEKAETEKFYPGRLTITHTGSVDTYTQLVNVLAIENGERLVGFQHGGWYGTAGAESWASESEYIYHAFITWGWTEQADFYGNMMPLPSPMLSDIADTHHPTNNQLIFVGTRMNFRNSRFDMSPSPVRLLSYRKIKRDFINALGIGARDALVYRPYHRVMPTLQDDAYVKRYFPQLPILNGSLHEAFLKCKLIVLDHPGTTLSLVMAANVPTVCYWDPNDWPLCPQAKVQFDLLRQAGILFDTPQAAATHINHIWHDVAGWWARPDVRAARQEWNDFHARTSPVWWWHWAVGIWKLACTVSSKFVGANRRPHSFQARHTDL